MSWVITLLCSRVILPEDGPFTVFKKKLLLTGWCAGSVLFLLQCAVYGFGNPESLVGLVSCVVALGYMCVMKSSHDLVNEVALYGCGVSRLLADAATVVMPYRSRAWPSFVLFVDIALVCRFPVRVVKVLISMIVMWLLISCLESTFRWGIYDWSYLPSQAERQKAISCTNIPCQHHLAFMEFFAQLAVFLLDFYFTRRFANDLNAEKEAMQRVIAASDHIARCLAWFDLEAAEAAIVTSLLPTPQHNSFLLILENLRVYRPYLPRSCLSDGIDGPCEPAAIDGIAASRESHDSMTETVTQTRNPPNLQSPSHMNVEVSLRRISYLVVNLLGSHKEAAAAVNSYHDRYTEYIEKVLVHVAGRLGVVGVVVGDHVHASFNAVKRCTTYAKGAVESALRLHGALDVACGVSMGTAHCGSYGCSALMSFGMIGRSVVCASILERFGRHNDSPVTCNLNLYDDVSFSFNMRLLLVKLHILGLDGEEHPFAVLPAAITPRGVEWLYELENKWGRYNDAAMYYVHGKYSEAAQIVAQEKGKAPQELKEPWDELSELLGECVPCREVVM